MWLLKLQGGKKEKQNNKDSFNCFFLSLQSWGEVSGVQSKHTLLWVRTANGYCRKQKLQRFETKQPYLCPSSLVTPGSGEPPLVLQHDLLGLPAREGRSESALLTSLLLHKQQLPKGSDALKYSQGLSHHQPLTQAMLFLSDYSAFYWNFKTTQTFVWGNSAFKSLTAGRVFCSSNLFLCPSVSKSFF